MIEPRFDQIPEELRSLRNWVVWKLVKRGPRSTKVPYDCRSGRMAKSNDPSSWSSFGDAAAALKRGYNGLGFCLTRPFVGIDLDGCRPNGTDEPWAEEIIRELGSYTELSPSGHGVHVIVKGELPDGPRQKDMGGEHHGVGLYDAARGRYLCMTGLAIHGNGIAERAPELERIHARLFPSPKPKPEAKPKMQANAPTSDEDLIERAIKANDGGKFARLWAGHWEGEYASQSEAHLALCVKLAF
jgi:primase-polymerase (primpol)-like protein